MQWRMSICMGLEEMVCIKFNLEDPSLLLSTKDTVHTQCHQTITGKMLALPVQGQGEKNSHSTVRVKGEKAQKIL